jgi:hypothetical protein
MRCSRRMWNDRTVGRGIRVALILWSVLSRIVTAQDSGVIYGSVTDSSGVPLTGVTVRLSGKADRRSTDNYGRFRIEHVAPGQQRIHATLIGFLPMMQELEVRSGESRQVRLSLQRLVLSQTPGPPRMARGTHVDTAPMFAEKIDEVSQAAGLTRLRPTPTGAPRRELRIWVMPGWGRSYVFRIVHEGRSVTGEVIFWVEQPLFEDDRVPGWRRYLDSLPVTMPREDRCGRISVDTLPAIARLARPRSLLVACRRQFVRRPDWSAVMRELDMHHVWTLPDEEELPQPSLILNDGTLMIVEVWDGQHYRSYTHANPGIILAPESEDAWAIMYRADSLARHTTRSAIR